MGITQARYEMARKAVKPDEAIARLLADVWVGWRVDGEITVRKDLGDDLFSAKADIVRDVVVD